MSKNKVFIYWSLKTNNSLVRENIEFVFEFEDEFQTYENSPLPSCYHNCDKFPRKFKFSMVQKIFSDPSNDKNLCAP